MYQFDKEDLEIEKKERESIQYEKPTLLSEKQVFFYYLNESREVQERYGLGRISKEGRIGFFLGNKAVLDKLNHLQKEWIAEWIKEKMKEGAWIET